MKRKNCPFKISKQKNILIISEPLGSVYGYYNKVHNQKLIHINSDVPYWMQNFIVAYQLYYAMRDEEYIFLTKSLNYHKEGLEFAIDLLCYKMDFKEFKILARRDGLVHNQYHYYKSMNELCHA